MKRALVLLVVMVIYYFTVFQVIYKALSGNLVVLLLVNLVGLALIYQFFKGQLQSL